jgi:hypothetical protein
MQVETLALKQGQGSIPLTEISLERQFPGETRPRELDPIICVGCGNLHRLCGGRSENPLDISKRFLGKSV